VVLKESSPHRHRGGHRATFHYIDLNGEKGRSEKNLKRGRRAMKKSFASGETHFRAIVSAELVADVGEFQQRSARGKLFLSREEEEGEFS